LIFWFRRDLRLEDNIAFTTALQRGIPVIPIFIFDKNILDKLQKNDPRITFIFETLQQMRHILQEQFKSSIGFYYNTPEMVFKKLCNEYDVQSVYANHDYEPYALQRDQEIKHLLSQKHIPLTTYKDQVIFEKNDIVKNDGLPYLVYTPYKNKWKEHFNPEVYHKYTQTR